MSWEFNVAVARSCGRCARDTLVDMAVGGHVFSLEGVQASFRFSTLVEGEPICRKCAAALLQSAAEQLGDS